MLLHLFTCKSASPEERSRLSFVLGSALAALGLAGLVTLALLEGFQLVPLSERLGSYTNGFLFGISGGILGAGISTAVAARRRLRDPEKMRRFAIKSHDERNLAIQSAAAKLTLISTFVLLYAAIVVCAFLRPALSMALSVFMIGLLALYLVFLLLLARRM